MSLYLMSVHGAAERTECGDCASEEEMEQASPATVVDGRVKQPVITDGPYREAKEYVGGCWIIDVPALEVALRLAAEGSKACREKIEVRPFHG